MNWIKKLFKHKPTKRPMTEDEIIEFSKQFCDLYHASCQKYGDDGHDQFKEVIERSSTSVVKSEERT